MRAWEQQRHYLIGGELILHFCHEPLKFIQGQHKDNHGHAKCVKYLSSFRFIINHKSGKLNKGANVLSRRYLLLSTLDSKVPGFKLIKEEHKADEDFMELFVECYSNHSH